METRRRTEADQVDRLGQELLDILKHEAAVLRQVEVLAASVRAAIAQRDLVALRTALAANEAELAAQEQLETRREACVAGLAEATGQPVESLSLARIAGLLPPRRQPALLSAQEALRAVTARLSLANRRNEDLAQLALQVVSESLAFFSELARRAGYAADGRSRHAPAASRVLDCRA